ncbi:MAG: ribonuclease E/G, partial [Hyphomonas sp.]
MSRLMLIDAAHPEETRVAIVNNGQVDDFDFEATGNEQLRGNIYLAKVTRVEPSLQAAFVEYGGNRHGFLAFSEIHPDYYQLPAEDREALLKEAAEEAAAAIEADDDDDGPYVPHGVAAEMDRGGRDHSGHDHDADDDHDHGDESEADADGAPDEDDEEGGDDAPKPRAPRQRARGERAARPASTRTPISKRYKIQEVIRRRQVMLVQVVKEERGNKGAALTTYLSLAGRYSVLMPNTPRGGGISRKIVNSADRKRLKSI